MPLELSLNTEKLVSTIKSANITTVAGKVESIQGPVIRATMSSVAIGDYLKIEKSDGSSIQSKVIGFEKSTAILSPLGSTQGLNIGARIASQSKNQYMMGGSHLLGNVFNANGEKIYGDSPSLNNTNYISKKINPDSPAPAIEDLKEIDSPFITGITAIDGLFTLGHGQRLAIFAEPGVGKTTLLGSIAKHHKADINVIALIGERGREVREFLEKVLDEETRQRSVIIASTSADPAVSRVNAALLATGIAEYFRDQGKDVLLTMDSLTRLFRSYRELGLAAGETPVRSGYPPSVFEQIPRLIERSGRTTKGSITALYSVLLSSSLDEDPMAEEVKGLTDGHIILRKELAEQGQYPAISILESLSRLMGKVASNEHQEIARAIQKFKSTFEQKKDLLLFSENGQEKLEALERINDLLCEALKQDMGSPHSLDKTLNLLKEVTRITTP